VDVLKNVVVNWLLPLLVAIVLWIGLDWLRRPEVRTDPSGRAPAFVLRDLEGRDVSLEGLVGKPVIVNFWATWCGPCRKEIPELNRFAAAHPEVPVLGISVDDLDSLALTKAARGLGIEYPVLRATGSVQRDWGVRTIPATFLVDAGGRIAESRVGTVSKRTLERWIR
jgi:thiol-disulfide isomerase/thioredoxin